jgi:hypothetical protein
MPNIGKHVTPGFLLDTNVWNAICDSLIAIERWSIAGLSRPPSTSPGSSPTASHCAMRSSLSFTRTQVPIEAATCTARAASGSAVIPRWDLVERIAGSLKGKRERKKRANWTDGLLAECAYSCGLILVTTDQRLASMATRLGVTVELVVIPVSATQPLLKRRRHTSIRGSRRSSGTVLLTRSVLSLRATRSVHARLKTSCRPATMPSACGIAWLRVHAALHSTATVRTNGGTATCVLGGVVLGICTLRPGKPRARIPRH